MDMACSFHDRSRPSAKVSEPCKCNDFWHDASKIMQARGRDLKGKTKRPRKPSFGTTQKTVVEHRRAERAIGPPWVRFFGKSIHARNFGYDVTSVHPSVCPPVQTVGVKMGRQDSLWDGSVRAIFP